MTQTFAEILILTPSVLNAGYLVWIADVLQQIMNDLDEARLIGYVLQAGFRSAREHPAAVSALV